VADPKFSRGEWTLTEMAGSDGGGEWFRLQADTTLLVDIVECPDGYVPGENRANAYLLWAARDLYAACEAIEEWDDDAENLPISQHVNRLSEAVKSIRAALAKARGEVAR
jgi:hypothetical protein